MVIWEIEIACQDFITTIRPILLRCDDVGWRGLSITSHLYQVLMLQMACTENKGRDFGEFFFQMIVLEEGNGSAGLTSPRAKWPWASLLTHDPLASSRPHTGETDLL